MSLNLSVYQQVLENAYLAFAQDESYAATILRKARLLWENKQHWTTRQELKIIETKAREKCAEKNKRDCHVKTPCGIGGCKFATRELRQLRDIKLKEVEYRKPTGGVAYDPSQAVKKLIELRDNANDSG